MAELHEVILRPLTTEKGARLQAKRNSFTFEVGTKANKLQIKQAVESLFGVKVESVRTMNVRGKVKRFGRYEGKRSNWKKAYVTLQAGNELRFFGS